MREWHLVMGIHGWWQIPSRRNSDDLAQCRPNHKPEIRHFIKSSITAFPRHGIVMISVPTPYSWWSNKMETFSAILAICAGNWPVPGEFPAQKPVTRSFDVFFDLRLNQRLIKQSWGWWFETLPRPVWRQCNVDVSEPVFCVASTIKHDGNNAETIDFWICK